MVDGLHITPVDDSRPPTGREQRGSDVSSGGGSGASSSAGVDPGMGPPAPEPGSESNPHEENPERDSKKRALNADEKSNSKPGGQAPLQPGEERVADIPDQPGLQLSIRVDEELNKPVFLIKEAATGNVVREVPSEELVELSKKMSDLLHGMLVNDVG